MSSRLWIVVILSYLVSGCSSHGMMSTDPIILTQPELILKSKTNTTLNSPLLISVVDEQANEGAGEYARTRGADYAAALTSRIVSAYPNAIKAAETDPDHRGSAFVQIRIRRLGAYVNRSGRVSMLGSVSIQEGNVGDWGPVIAAADDSEPASFGTRYVNIPNNWSGVANIDILVKDLDPGRSASFHFPIVAERIVQNDFGAMRASSIAESAWKDVAPRLARFLDAAVEKRSADEQAGQTKTQ